MRKIYLLISLVVLGIYIYINYSHIQQTIPSTTIPTENHTTSSAEPTSQVPSSNEANTTFPNDTYLVTKVVDGDTIEIEGGQRVRYIGVDTPESTTTTECFGKAAAEENKSLVLGEHVLLEKDVSETDRYGRLLRYVYVGEVMVNDYLVRNGYANASSYPPDVKYQDQFRASEKNAREAGKGLWSECTKTTSKTTITADPNCPVKGNISKSTKEKIYHVPGGKFYDQTIIGDVEGEQCFASESEAVREGWRKSKL